MLATIYAGSVAGILGTLIMLIALLDRGFSRWMPFMLLWNLQKINTIQYNAVTQA